MGWRQKKREVLDRLRPTPWLRPVFHHVLDIPYRVYQYHPDLFIVLNRKTGRYEVHSLQQQGDTWAMDCRFRLLDERLLRDIRRNDVRVHGKNILRRIRKSQEDWQRRRERNRHAWEREVAKETRTAWARLAWGDDGLVSVGWRGDGS